MGSLEQMRSAYERNGFIIVPGLLPRADVLSLRAHAEGLIARGANGGPVPYVQATQDRQGRTKVIKASGLAERDARFTDMVTRGPLVDVVEALLGAGARRFRDVMIVKPPHTGGSFSYHQDSAYWDVEPKALVSCWIALGDVPINGSCLQVVPGTHRQEIEHHLYLNGRLRVPPPVTRTLRRLVSLAGTGDNPEGTGGNLLAWKAKRWVLSGTARYVPIVAELQDFRIPPSAIESDREERLAVRAGDVVFFHSLLWHASGPNETDQARIAEIISFMGPQARFVGRGPGHFPPARAV
jgi:ectoine hydroxylase-related dioxygenase (phytanoyl-CoA dioxygenase family)